MDLWLKIATVLENTVLVLLFGLSVWSISIMIDRRRVLRKEQASVEGLRALIDKRDANGVKQWLDANPGVHAGTLQAAMAQPGPEVDRAVKSYLTEERLRLEKGLPILATLGANAPFIGLFGTVLGIIRAFAALGQSSGEASSVMSGISLALIATAAGLFVAIPAVVAFNTFSNRLRTLIAQSEALKDHFVSKMSPSSRGS